MQEMHKNKGDKLFSDDLLAMHVGGKTCLVTS